MQAASAAFALCAHHHRRADPWHQTRLAIAMNLAEGLTEVRTERFTGGVMKSERLRGKRIFSEVGAIARARPPAEPRFVVGVGF